MSGEPADKPGTIEKPATLNYATHIGESPRAQDRRALTVLLIGLTALGNVWSIILGIMSLDAWFFGLLLTGSGVCVFWATVGKLSAKGMRLRAAARLATRRGIDIN